MFLPHIKLNNLATVANVATAEPVRAAAAAAPPSGGFLGTTTEPVMFSGHRGQVVKFKIAGLPKDSDFAAMGFGRQMEYRQSFRDFAARAKTIHLSQKRQSYTKAIREAIKLYNVTEFYCCFYADKNRIFDDSFEFFYVSAAPPSGGFLGDDPDGMPAEPKLLAVREYVAKKTATALSTAAADGFRETVYSCEESNDCEACSLWFKNTGRGLWRFYVYSPERDHFSCVGLQYSTKMELLADLDRYAQEYGFPAVAAADDSETLQDTPSAGFLADEETEAGEQPQPQPAAVGKCVAQFMRDDENDTFDDFERREAAVIFFGKQIEASRVATIGDIRYSIAAADVGSGFTISVTGPDGLTETYVSGRYGFRFETFGQTVDYAVQRARARFVCQPETVYENQCQIERRYHKRRNVWVYVVTLLEPLSGSRFKTEESRAKRAGGWYAREFKPEFQRGGFMFLERSHAECYALQYRPSGKVATMPRNEPPSAVFLADDSETAEQAERADAETRLERLPPSSGRSAAKWIVNGFAGTSGPPTVFDRKSDAIDWAIANKKAVSARLERERKAAEPMRGEFLSDGAKLRFNPTGHSCQHYGECESCKCHNGSEYWIASGPKSTAFYCQPCTLRLQAHMDLQPLPIPADVPTFGDTVQTPEGIVGTMRGSGGMGSDRVGVVDAAGKLQTYANRSELKRVEPSPAAAGRAVLLDAMARKLETLADRMQETIDHKTRPMTQNWTHKRGGEYASRMHDGENLQRCQAALRFLAGLWRAGTIPDGLRHLTNKTAVLPLVSEYRERENGRPFVGDERYHNNTDTAKQLRALMTPVADPARELRKKLDAAEAKLRTCCDGVPGFFPTPPALAAKVIEAAELPATPSDDFFVLEPSAGIGSLCDAVAQDCPELKEQIDAVETWGPAADVIELKGFGHVFRDDFLSINPDRFGQLYDRIVMNPPFESLADIEHVRHAYKFLKPGGRLVAVMSDGSFFSTTRSKVTDFRDWLDSCDAEFVRTDDDSETFRGAFTGATAFRQTGVNVRIVVIDKPA